MRAPSTWNDGAGELGLRAAGGPEIARRADPEPNVLAGKHRAERPELSDVEIHEPAPLPHGFARCGPPSTEMSDDRAKLDDGEGRWSPRYDIRLVRGSDADIRRVGAPD